MNGCEKNRVTKNIVDGSELRQQNYNRKLTDDFDILRKNDLTFPTLAIMVVRF